jgi:hypothetical protein
MKEIKITIISNNWNKCFKIGGIPDVVLQNHSSLYRHNIEWSTWKKGIEIELLKDGEVIDSYGWNYEESDFHHYDSKIIEFIKRLD